MRLTRKKAIVTGGASGIGRAIALSFAGEGADVAIFDYDLAKAQAVADEMAAETKQKLFAVACDVGDGNQVARACTEADGLLGAVDILVNNAGIIRQNEVLNTPEEEWDWIIRNNLKSVFLCSKQAAIRMTARAQGGRIISISSIHAVLSLPGCAYYTAAKGGIEAFCRTLASELAPDRITVNCIRPGATYTELTTPMYTDAVVRSLYERVPQRQIAQPVDRRRSGFSSE